MASPAEEGEVEHGDLVVFVVVVVVVLGKGQGVRMPGLKTVVVVVVVLRTPSSSSSSSSPPVKEAQAEAKKTKMGNAFSVKSPAQTRHLAAGSSCITPTHAQKA